MRRFVYILFLSFCPFVLPGQNNLSRLVDAYHSLDEDCYTQLIQKSLDEFNAWLPSHPEGKEQVEEQWGFYDKIKPHFVDLSKERKLFMLAVYMDWEKYCSSPFMNATECLTVDSTRMFVIACLDDRGHIKGITDVGETGLYVETTNKIIPKCLWFDLDVINSRKGRDALINAYKLHPQLRDADAILWSSNNEDGSFNGYSSILFIKDEHVFQWHFWDNQLHELNGQVRNTLLTWSVSKGVLHNCRDDLFDDDENVNWILYYPVTMEGKRYKYGITPTRMQRVCK